MTGIKHLRWRLAKRRVGECARIRKQPSATMPVVCERFKVVYRHTREPVA